MILLSRITRCLAPVGLTLAPNVPEKAAFFSRKVDLPQIDQGGYGVLEVYICYACGAVEWYCGDVATIPIHPWLMTEVVDYDAGTPYR